ncbi:MAG TPA: chromate resistance protein [Microbacteriaceae bacterium]|jgi:DNA-binding transcriptional regulator PaaX|nr:chromate resistance protein [Microbacteriaceae bacterium]
MARDDQWVLLSYRLPRLPSTPRSAVWRKLNRLGVAQLADGLVALPADARTREALEWIAEEVLEHHGEAMVWLGQPADTAGRVALVERMTAATAAEYDTVLNEAAAMRDSDPPTRRRVVARLRRELHRIDARDFFPPPQRNAAWHAVDELATEPTSMAQR